jgi:hypothetical protein
MRLLEAAKCAEDSNVLGRICAESGNGRENFEGEVIAE